MYAIFVLIIISLTVAIGFLIAFIWAVKNNQYEDDYTPSVRILFDDEVSQVKDDVESKENQIIRNEDNK